MRYEDENIWLAQKAMAQLYDVSVQSIGQHIKKVLDDGELIETSVIKKYFITITDVTLMIPALKPHLIGFLRLKTADLSLFPQ